MTGVLRNRAFRWVGAVYVLDALLEWFGTVALMVVVFNHTDSTAAAAALLICKQVAPVVVVPALGALLDRWSTSRSLVALFATQAAALLVIGGTGFSLALFPLALVAGTAGTLVRSRMRAAVASILDGPDFRHGNAAINVALAITGLVGPACAGFVVAGVGPDAALMVGAAALALCGLVSWNVPTVVAPSVDADGESAAPAAGTARHSTVPLPWLLALVGLVTCVFSMDAPALLAYSERSLHAGVGGYGVLYACWGLGLVIGGLVFSRLVRFPMLRVYACATLVTSAGYFGMGLASSIWLAGACAVIGGLGNGMDWVALVTAVQEAAPRGREASAARSIESIARAASGFGILLGGIVAREFAPRAALLVPGGVVLGTLFFAVLALRLRDSRFRRTAQPIFSPSIPGGSA